MGSVLRRVALVGVAAGVLVGCVAAFAVAAAKPNKPVITITSGPAEGATVTSGSLSLAFTYNRTPKQTKTLTCVLSGPTSSSAACDAPAALGATGSQSGASYSGLANGSYTFLVSLTLTDGGSTSATRHFRVAGPAIAAGAYHSCALTSTGAVTCWGNNGLGQLGNGTTTDSSTPVAVTGLSSGVTAIAAGSYHSCALTSAGVVKCWGNNVSGELGNGSTIDSSTPVAVTGLSGVTAIAAGGSHSCALTSAGTVTCWGANFVGQLGNGTTTNSSTPVAVTGLSSGVTAIAAGGSDSCALTSAGAATCWGDNVSGQLGNGSTADSSTPVAVTGLANRVTEIATGAYHSCARTSAGAATCWGYNGYGELGDGTTTSSSTPVDVVF